MEMRKITLTGKKDYSSDIVLSIKLLPIYRRMF
jgi:hypothetical protein